MNNTKPTYEELENEIVSLKKIISNLETDPNATLHYHYASINKINRAIHLAQNIDEMMSFVLQAILEIFNTERAWLVFPYDPVQKTGSVYMTRTLPGFEKTYLSDEALQLRYNMAQSSEKELLCNEVNTYNYDKSPNAAPLAVASEMLISVQPRTGGAWLLGIHQCTYTRSWTKPEKALFKSIASRLEDALSGYLNLKNFVESERKFRIMIDASPLALYLSSGIEQKGEYMNPTFKNLFGYTLNDVPNIEAWWALAYPDEVYRKKLQIEWQIRTTEAIQQKKAIEPIEVVVRCKDGSLKNIIWGFVSTGNDNWSFGLDVTAQRENELRVDILHKELEQKVQDRTKELELKNNELEKINKVFVGRELRMAELKKRIRILETELKGKTQTR